MGSRPIVLVSTIAALVGTIIALTLNRPFQYRMGTYTTDLEPRSAPQRTNIAEGARRLDGTVIEPGEVLSFNRVVGPRTAQRGFVAAPAFLEGVRLESVGGGICQVSSTLYDAALLSGLEIRRRVAHDRVVQSVPPGADATVWYGKADLAIANPFGQPVRVSARVVGDRLTIGFDGPDSGSTYALAFDRAASPDGKIRVRVFRTVTRPGEEPRRELTSDDNYRR